MNNQTIAGVLVSRELLENLIAKAYGEKPGNPDIELDELRALLDAPAVESELARMTRRCQNAELALKVQTENYEALKAAQPQGGPAGYVIPGDMPAQSGYTKTVNPVSEGKYTFPLYSNPPADTISSAEGLRSLLVEIYNHHGTTTDHCDRIRVLLSQREQIFEVEPLTNAQIEAVRTASTATNIPRERFSKGLFKNE